MAVPMRGERRGRTVGAIMHSLTTDPTRVDQADARTDLIRLFDVDELGVSLLDLRRDVVPSFRTLPWDEYDVRRARVALLSECFPDHAAELDAFLPAFFAGTRDFTELRELVIALDERDRVRLSRIRPTRRRALASFTVRKATGGWDVTREPDAPFSQSGDDEHDYRQFTRRFAPSPRRVTDAPAYRALLD